MSNPTKEYGFVIITKANSQAFEPKQMTDDIWSGEQNKWLQGGAKQYTNSRFQPASTYRRRISPGEGFEIVPADEKSFSIGDIEHTFDGLSWFRSTHALVNRLTCLYSDVLAFRRPIKQPVITDNMENTNDPDYPFPKGHRARMRAAQEWSILANQVVGAEHIPIVSSKDVMLNQLTNTVTALALAIDPTATHGPETEKIVAYANTLHQTIAQHNINPAGPSPWLPITQLTGMPDDGLILVCGVYDGTEAAFTMLLSVSRIKAGYFNPELTHWQPIAQVPKPPKPITEEEALKELMESETAPGWKAYVQEGWNSHIEFLKKGGK